MEDMMSAAEVVASLNLIDDVLSEEIDSIPAAELPNVSLPGDCVDCGRRPHQVRFCRMTNCCQR